MDNLPSVLSYLTSEEANIAKFVKPTLGLELKEVCGDDSCISPKSSIMAIRLLTLSPNMVVPMHIHFKKEKIYICQGPGVMRVMMQINGKDNIFVLTSNEVIVIPPNTPHFVSHFVEKNQISNICNVVVVSSSLDGQDICWEDRAGMLVQDSLHR